MEELGVPEYENEMDCKEISFGGMNCLYQASVNCRLP
jgi:hypothetical protein